MQYVSRGGAATPDFYYGSFTSDSSWHSLTLPTFVPTNANLVQFQITWSNEATGTSGSFRKPGMAGDYGVHSFQTLLTDELHYKTILMECVNRQISYNFNTTSWVTFSLTIIGWFI
jgi:hypothetical protein